MGKGGKEILNSLSFSIEKRRGGEEGRPFSAHLETGKKKKKKKGEQLALRIEKGGKGEYSPELHHSLERRR